MYHCYFGTDVPSSDQLIARHNTLDEIRKLIGADSLGFLSVDRLSELMEGDCGFCQACFTGEYAVNPIEEEED